ncbi:MAG: zinc-binding dehydrogenase [Gammaproteobacteria bacterium]
MRAVVMRRQQLVVDDFPDPKPGHGEVVINVKACGICGSDLHALKYGEEFVTQSRQGGTIGLDMDIDQDVVMGHEYCGEIVEFGAGCQKDLAVGNHVCSIPALLRAPKLHTLGYSNEHPGGFAEYMRLTEAFLEPVPNGLAPDLAALTEPMAVGLHAVNKARLAENDVPLVIGCGPVGLAVVASLKQRQIGPIVAADFSPTRRQLAERVGADVVIDPAAASPFGSWREIAAINGNNTRPSWVGPKFRPAVIFECVGVPGVLDSIMKEAVHGARIIVVGVCMQRDHIHPVYGVNKELNLQFVVAYNRREFSDALRHIAEGELPVEPLITGNISLDEVPAAFDALSAPDKHAKILVRPNR